MDGDGVDLYISHKSTASLSKLCVLYCGLNKTYMVVTYVLDLCYHEQDISVLTI